MIFDAQAMFSDNQGIDDDGDATPSTNVIDLGVPGTPRYAKTHIDRDFGRGRVIPIRIQVTQAFVGLDGLSVAVQMAPEADFVDDSGAETAVTVATTVIAGADLVAGHVAPIVYVPLGITERYLRLCYGAVVPSGKTMVAGEIDATKVGGKIVAGLVAGNENWSA